MTGPAQERAAEAAAEKAALDAEVEKHSGWGVREILHNLNDRLSKPHYERAGEPSPAAVGVLIDKAHGYSAPVPSAVDDAAAELAAAQAKLDAAKAEAAAGVEHTTQGF